MRMRRRVAGLALALLGVSAIDSFGQVRGNSTRNGAVQSQAPVVPIVIDRNEERIIRDWFGNSANLNGLPPGLAKKDKLPPGLQRQLAKNGKLPPGLQRRIQPLPMTLQVRLPILPQSRKWIFLGGNVIILDQRTSSIVDMITDIF